MIEINGLTSEQKQMLNFMWSELESLEDYENWLETLDDTDQMQAMTLSKMIILAVIDEQSNRLEYYPQAEKVLEKYYI
jgi:hypothetical protein